ncbi:tetratricopeptide repeat protein [Azospirillum sp.]|uniref:tetratricopeptide repeat protein n=1 Tax=Azospirillum sp. TaxID=34012 RepID=UPI003D72385C
MTSDAEVLPRLSLAVRLHQGGQVETAAGLYRMVLALNPAEADALHLSGLIAYQGGDAARSAALVGRAVRLRRSPEFLCNHALALEGAGRPAEAAAAARGAVDLAPDLAEAHLNLGNALNGMQRWADAVAALSRAVALRPAFANAWSSLGFALEKLGEEAQAEVAYRTAAGLNPALGEAWGNLGRVLTAQGRCAEALEAFVQAVRARPDNPKDHWNLALALLLNGRLAEGFAEYEWRWLYKDFSSPRRSFAPPLWTGGPLEGRTILLHAEQGLGDAIQFARYAREVARMGARVVLEAHPPLRRLFAGLEGVSAQADLCGPLPDFDLHAPLLSLPRLVGRIAAEVPYLTAEADRVEAWRHRLGGGVKVGLVWAGNPGHANDANRSLPLAALEPLLRTAGVRFFAVQKEPRPGDRAILAAHGVAELGPDLHDFADTAAALEALDLLVTVDTAVAHLAGALGRPVWLLLPFVPDWRWMLERADSPWYPTMRLFRQDRRGDWPGVVERVSAALQDAVS